MQSGNAVASVGRRCFPTFAAVQHLDLGAVTVETWTNGAAWCKQSVRSATRLQSTNTTHSADRAGPRLGVKVLGGYVVPDMVLVKTRIMASKHRWVAGEGTRSVKAPGGSYIRAV